MSKFHIVVLASGAGSGLQCLIDNQLKFDYEILATIADRDCYALKRAQKHHIPTFQLARQDNQDLCRKLAEILLELDRKYRLDLIVLAGFLSILDKNIVAAFKRRIINIHPSLLPLHGGKGMFGLKVHAAVIRSGQLESGCSVHYVTEAIDQGPVIIQKKVKVDPEESPNSLQEKVKVKERQALLEAISLIKQKNLR